MTTKTRMKDVNQEAPQTQKQAEQWLQNLATKQRRVKAIEDAMNEQLTELKKKFEQQAKPLNEDIEDLFAGIKSWASVNRDDLCKKGVKSVSIATGQIGWRKNPPSVRLVKVQDVIERLKRLKLSKFIRVAETVDKEAILKNKESAQDVAGIHINPGAELFYVEPFETEIEKASVVR